MAAMLMQVAFAAKGAYQVCREAVAIEMDAMNAMLDLDLFNVPTT